jgi:hypothetical protein
MRTIQNCEQNKQWEKNIIYKKYILKLFLNKVTSEIEALVVVGNKLLYACVKEVCHLWAQPLFDTFCQLLIIVEILWSQPVSHVGKQVAVAWSEIRTLRRLVKQLPVEILQQCSSASSCMWTCIVMEQHETRCQHSVSFVLNGPIQFFQCLAIQNVAEAADFLDRGIQKLIPRCNRCLNSSSDYFGK